MSDDGTTYDGVICMGGVDWWYHNRGHYDLQMMREFSRGMPVLYVNSIGMRVPRAREGRMFLSRVLRKFKSMRRGLVPIRENFSVLSPVAAPGRLARTVQGLIMPWQIKRAAKKLGITRPLLWIACPPAASVIDAIDPVAVVYQRTDRFEAFPGVDVEAIKEFDARLRVEADVVLYCNRGLFNAENATCKTAMFVDHGVDFDVFEAAGIGAACEPADVAAIPRPRAGFVGSIDAHTFAPKFFNDVVALLPEVHFVMVGGCSLPEGWCSAENVHFLGQKDYAEVASYMASCDVLLMPWNDSPWIKACNPIKLKEYLAVGRPVVSTSFDELEHWKDVVEVHDDAAGFAAAITTALKKKADSERIRDHVRAATWHVKAREVVAGLSDLGIDCEMTTPYDQE